MNKMKQFDYIRILAHALQAMYHMSSAVSGHASRDKDFKGYETNERKIDESMMAANSHISHVWNYANIMTE